MHFYVKISFYNCVTVYPRCCIYEAIPYKLSAVGDTAGDDFESLQKA